jgi:DNA mismatch endonuclease (patch repair protein)
VLTIEQRRLNMSRIKGRNTKPEMLIRRGLHARGLRYRLNVSTLPGRPDLVFPRHGVVVFIHGCFWHGHDCPMFHMPETRREFWQGKIAATQVRDGIAEEALLGLGWRVLTVWECSLRGRNRVPLQSLLDSCADFIYNGGTTRIVKGVPPSLMHDDSGPMSNPL